MLKNIQVLDLSLRLPGPFAASLLADLGANVIKVEDKNFRDPFIQKNGPFDESFKYWYEEINKNKKVSLYDFKNDQDILQIIDLIKSSQIIILGPPRKIREKLSLTEELIQQFEGPKVFIDLLASPKHDVLHDLNAQALSGFLELYLDNKSNMASPSSLPWGGVLFGHQIVQEVLSLYITSTQNNTIAFHNSFLTTALNKVMTCFWPHQLREGHQTKFLHNGVYPCYYLYQAKDKGWLAFACVEDKFWKSFIDLAKINLTMDSRFDKSGKTHQIIAEYVSNKSTKEFELLLQGKDICISIIGPQAKVLGA